MTPTIEIDEATHRSLELAARLTGVSVGGVVSRLVAQTIASPNTTGKPAPQPQDRGGVALYVDYAGHRTHAQYDPTTHRIDITSGPLAEQKFKSPSSAAVAVVSQAKPEVDPNRNGWNFWILDDGSGRRLQSIRHG